MATSRGRRSVEGPAELVRTERLHAEHDSSAPGWARHDGGLHPQFQVDSVPRSQGFTGPSPVVCIWADAERSGTLWEMLQEEQGMTYERLQRVLTYNIDDRDSWLRTVDFTPPNAFGRSFACRRVSPALCQPVCTLGKATLM